MKLAPFLKETVLKEIADLVTRHSGGLTAEVSRDGGEIHVNIDGIPETLVLVERDR